MELKSKDYVAVSGISSLDEAKNVLKLIRITGFDMQTTHVPMLGFQVSWKSLDFGFSEGNKRIPPLKELPSLLDAVKDNVFPTIHYYTKRPDSLVQEVGTILERDGIYNSGLVGGLQINGVFPAPYKIKILKDIYPELKIVLQISPSTDSMQQLAKKLANDYKELDYVILDPSYGKGIEFDTPQIASAYRALRDNGVESSIVFAGGMNGNNVKSKLDHLERIVGSKEFSIDAEGGLRDKVGEGYGNDTLNLGKVARYLRGASDKLLHDR
jgi:hypothetical protein